MLNTFIDNHIIILSYKDILFHNNSSCLQTKSEKKIRVKINKNKPDLSVLDLVHDAIFLLCFTHICFVCSNVVNIRFCYYYDI